MREMTVQERRDFLAEGTRTGKVAITRRDGRPHVVPVWFVLDGDDVLFTTSESSAKGRALLRDGRASLTVDLERAPYAYVNVEGHAEISRDGAELRRVAAAVGGRYMGEERAEEFGARNATPGELVVRLRPERVTAYQGIAE